MGLCTFHYMRKRKGVALAQPKQHHRRASAAVDPVSGCTILGCGRPVAALGMCWGHYRRDLRGEPVHVYLVPRASRTAVAQFGPARPPYRVLREYAIRHALGTLYTPEPNTGCWLWLGEILPSGYGRVGNHRDPWGGYAHRAVLHFSGVQMAGGRKMHVRHSCDNPACVNPEHLAYGTARENMMDRERRGRSGIATHTAEQAQRVRELASAGLRTMDIARQLHVDAGFVSRVRSGRGWSWLPDSALPAAA